MITLENEAEVLPAQGGELVPAEGGSVAPGHQIGPLARLIQAAQQVHQGGFAGARSADDGHHLSTGDRQIDAIEHGDGALTLFEVAADAPQLQQGAHGHIPMGAACPRRRCSGLRSLR